MIYGAAVLGARCSLHSPLDPSHAPSTLDPGLSTLNPDTMMDMRAIGRTLQVVGLILLPLSMVMELDGGLGRSFGVSDMVLMLVFGAAAFAVGRLVEGYARA